MINVYPVDQDGSARYRLIWPAEAMIAQGLDVQLCSTGTVERDADTIVMNRPVREAQAQCVEELTGLGKRVIIDMDDWYSRIVQGHVAYGSNADAHIERACKAASGVTVTTPTLLEPYGFGHGSVWPNYVPEWTLDIKPGAEHAKPWVLWMGTVSSHPTDLQSTKGQVAKAMNECEAELAYIGPKYQGEYVRKFLSWKGKTHLAGWFDDQKLLMEAMASATVGIVPLDDTSFNSAKSALKMSEFAAVGVPAVGAATPDNIRLNKLGVGLIAKHPRDWYFHIRNLLRDENYRREIAERGREAMSKLTIEGHAHELYELWAGFKGPSIR